MNDLNRRAWIASLLGWQVAATVGCSRPSDRIEGALLSTSFGIGHQIRDGLKRKQAPDSKEQVPIVVIGGGIAGLSAAWRLLTAGIDDFIVLELEQRGGGTARGGATGNFTYPWGAHYIPVPMPNNVALIKLLEQMDVVERRDDDGNPVVREQYLCRDPFERLFHGDQWHEGIYPYAGATDDDLRQLTEFRAEIDRWIEARDSKGRRMFAVPMATASDEADVQALDSLSMKDWMDEHGWDSARLRWFVEYACRDDYGLSLDRVSAWAGVFYFAARVTAAGEEAQDIITWPEGNGRVADYLLSRVGERIRCHHAVCEIDPVGAAEGSENSASVLAVDTERGNLIRFDAEHVIFAAPQMLVRHLIRQPQYQPDVQFRQAFQYGSWLVANVHLRDRPAEHGFPMCWDNVIYGTKSLGYVTSTHQVGIDYGPTVLTWYYPFADVDPKQTRQDMLNRTWDDWADLVMTDLRVAHGDIDRLVTRIDVMLWGHAMVQPSVGFLWSQSRRDASKPVGSVHFAGTDLSGIPLFEEAFYHGVRAAEEVLQRRKSKFSTLLPIIHS